MSESNTSLATEQEIFSLEDRYDEYLDKTRSSLYHVFGVDCQQKRCNLALDDFNLLYITGNCLVQENLKSNKRRYLLGRGGGIGCLLVDKQRNRVFLGNNALSEQVGSCICVYSLPNFALTRRLFDGSEKGYKCFDLNSDGTKLASISSLDNSLTIWDLGKGTKLLKTKEFGQNVCKVLFSPYDDRSLSTSGSGHICFWTLAQTFTGLKLNGRIGKFGKADKCDIDTFVIAKDGKVVTGSESGHGLLWESGIVKCRLVCCSESGGEACSEPKSKSLHDGRIFFMRYEASEQQLMTSGVDGKIKWWCMRTIETAEMNSAVGIDLFIEPIRVVSLGDGIKVWNLAGPVEGESTIVVANLDGGLYLVDLTSEYVCKKVDGHGGTVVGFDASPVEHICVTACTKGIINCWDYTSKALVCSTKTRSPCSTIRWAPKEIDFTGRTIAIGHETGALRLVYIKNRDLVLRLVVKPHTKMITCIRFTKCGSGLATASADGTVFLFRCAVISTAEDELKLIPVGFVDCGEYLKNIELRLDASGFIYSKSTCEVVELEWGNFTCLAPRLPDTSFALNASVVQNKKSATYLGEHLGESAAIALFQEPPGDRKWQNAVDMEHCLVHDVTFSLVGSCLSWDKAILLKLSADGTLGVLYLKTDAIVNDEKASMKIDTKRCTNIGGALGANELIDEYFLTQVAYDSLTRICVKETAEIDDYDFASLEEEIYTTKTNTETLKTEKANQSIQEMISTLRLDYLQLVQMNAALPEAVKMQRLDLTVDSEEVEVLKHLKNKEIIEVRNRCFCESEKINQMQADIQNNFLGVIDWEHFAVKGLSDNQLIHSFTTWVIPSFVRDVADSMRITKSNSGFQPQRDSCDQVLPKSIVEKPAFGDMQVAGDYSSTGNSYNTRKTKRLERTNKLLEKRCEMPDENSYDDRLAENIQVIQNNRGDYVVKTSPAYLSAASDLKSAEAMLEQLALLHSSINSRKCAFNDGLLNLWYTRKELISYKKAIDEHKPGSSSIFTDQGLFLLSQSFDEEQKYPFLKMVPTKRIQTSPFTNTQQIDLNLQLSSILPVLLHSSISGPFAPCLRNNDTSLMVEEKTQAILKDLQSRIYSFNRSLRAHRQDRSELSFGLKQSEFRITELIQEIEQLIKFKKRDSELLMNVSVCSKTKGEVSKIIDDCHVSIESIQTELQVLLARDAEVLEEMMRMVPESCIYRLPLARIFARKRTRTLDKNDIADSAEKEDDYEDSVTDEGGDSCPEGCDLKLYNQVLTLRDSRHMIEQELIQFQRKLRNTKQIIDLQKEREQQLSRELELVNKDLCVFQLKKQEVANEILVIRALKTSQIFLWHAPTEKSSAAGDVTSQIKSCTCSGESLLFFNERLVSLWKRICQLKEEIARDKDEFMELQRELARLENSKLSKEDYIKNLKAKTEELELLKFGQLVDINELDRMTLSTIDDDLHEKEVEKIKTNKKICQSKLENLKLLKEKLLNSTNENTSLLNQFADLTEKLRFSEKRFSQNATFGQSESAEDFQIINKAELLDLRNQSQTQKLHINSLQNFRFRLLLLLFSQ